MNNRRKELAPCGVFCAACPSFDKTCLGCSSEIKEQNRKSKWNCTIRHCCYEEKKIDYCGYCDTFVCDKINTKLINSHIGQPEFKYRHEIPENMERIKKLGVEQYIETKSQEYLCPICNGTIHFYSYTCNRCGKRQIE